MDEARNPYTPNAGAPPRFLAGRRRYVSDFRVLLQRLSRGYTEQSMIVTGLRGVGKTVLLGEYRRVALDEGWVPVEAEVSKNTLFASQITGLARRALFDISPRARWTDRSRRVASVVRNFSLTVAPDGSLAAGLDVDPEPGRADTGSLIDDLPDLFEALGEIAADQERGVVFLFDEIQFLSKQALEALIAAVHRTVQRQLPVTFAGAGLPQLPGLAGDAKSYAERLFTFPAIKELSVPDACEALLEPARFEQVTIETHAVDHVVSYTEGFPYFLQEYGRAMWRRAEGQVITGTDATAAQDVVEATLDESFFRSRVQRSAPAELRYMRAMAELGPDAQRAADVASILRKNSEQVAPLRARLIGKGLLYTPRYGYAKFTVPQFDRFMRRYMELDQRPPEAT